MSASTEKKVRAEAVKAGTDKKTIAAQEAAKAAAKSKRKWTIGTIAIVLVIAFAIIINTGILYSKTTAVKINGVSYSPAQVNYYYGSAYSNFVNSYGSYASYFGLNTSNGISGLGTQTMSGSDKTWKDYFLEQAETQMAQIAAYSDYAKANSISVSDEKIAEIDEQIAEMKSMVTDYGYKDFNQFLEINYGKGVNEKIFREESIKAQLASEGYNYYVSTLQYSSEELAEEYASLNGDYDMVKYSVYTVNAEDTDADEAISEEELAAAEATANAIAASYNESEGSDYNARLNAALAANDIDAEVSTSTSQLSSVNDTYKEWIASQPAAGTAAVFSSADNEASYVVVFELYDNNNYEVGQVRHILVMAEADENGVYTDEAKAEAKAKAEEILEQWKSGDATEESFAALADELSDDSSEGGLYSTVDRYSYVPEFTAFALGSHNVGDTAIVYGESTSYAGYHVMYYVGKGPVYSDYIAENLLKNEAIDSWSAEITAPYEAVRAGGFRYAAV